MFLCCQTPIETAYRTAVELKVSTLKNKAIFQVKLPLNNSLVNQKFCNIFVTLNAIRQL